jgi:hypothetical protein
LGVHDRPMEVGGGFPMDAKVPQRQIASSLMIDEHIYPRPQSCCFTRGAQPRWNFPKFR